MIAVQDLASTRDKIDRKTSKTSTRGGRSSVRKSAVRTGRSRSNTKTKTTTVTNPTFDEEIDEDIVYGSGSDDDQDYGDPNMKLVGGKEKKGKGKGKKGKGKGKSKIAKPGYDVYGGEKTVQELTNTFVGSDDSDSNEEESHYGKTDKVRGVPAVCTCTCTCTGTCPARQA